MTFSIYLNSPHLDYLLKEVISLIVLADWDCSVKYIFLKVVDNFMSLLK